LPERQNRREEAKPAETTGKNTSHGDDSDINA